MLQFKGTRQAPRKYTIPVSDGNNSTSSKSLCVHCLTRVWNSKLITALSNAPLEQESVAVSYDLSTSILRQSVIAGFYDLYQATIDDDASISSENTGSQATGDPEGVSDDDAWVGAEDFNEDASYDEVAGAWDLWQERDVLQDEVDLMIGLRFERGEAGTFSFLNAIVEVSATAPIPSTVLRQMHGKRAVELRYYVHDSGFAGTDTPSIFPFVTANRELGNELNMRAVDRWVKSFSLTSCNTTLPASQLPARLIDLDKSEILRVIETRHIYDTNLQYAALSYVWGANQKFVLTSTTRSDLENGFDASHLPRTIRDAIKTARRTGLRYIWVDALCIIQDSDEDKARELPKMRTIYKHAAVTVVAAVAKSAHDGFLHHIDHEPAYFIEPVRMPIILDKERSADLVISYPADYKRWRDPINARAWTFQELILSMRVVQFSYRGIETIDRTDIPSAAGLTSGKDPQLPNPGWNGKMLSLEADPENTRQTWLSLRAEYSRRNLSFRGDKLLAIAAIAEEVGRTYNSHYLAGMWERDLAMDLQWTRSREWNSDSMTIRDSKSQQYVAPSWSWASIETAVEDFDHVAEGQGDAGGRGLRDMCGFEVLSCEVEPTVPGFDYGAVKAGVLVVKGLVCVMIWRPYTDRKSKVSTQSDGRLVQRQDEAASFNASNEDTALLDAIDPELHDGSLVTCLATRRVEHKKGREDVEGLIILPVDSIRYRRVGFFTFTRPDSWTEMETAVITIV
ncbi:hypothetical protein E8E12_006925 [Didymella heteroderae]|uniref:Heterokaryon incompatibility domain-containing protein n=1 Tax=Didymella heteroderae TaxID=1769908 RepID=A0A9P5C097_9PLEO|nr:hypothetical protein E8E12_006925 [Didymella heteroderae]